MPLTLKDVGISTTDEHPGLEKATRELIAEVLKSVSRSDVPLSEEAITSNVVKIMIMQPFHTFKATLEKAFPGATPSQFRAALIDGVGMGVGAIIAQLYDESERQELLEQIFSTADDVALIEARLLRELAATSN